MRLRHIEMFNALMMTGSVSGAAKLINVSQPAVSRMLLHAEMQLGFQLFQRIRNRLVPTREATILYPHVERVFSGLDEVQRVSASLKGGQAVAELRIASILTLGHEVIPRALKIFNAKHPDVGVVIKTFHSPQMVSALLLNEADVGFLYGPVSHPALQMEQVGEAQIVCVAPKGLLSARTVKKGAVSLQELATTRVIGVESTQTLGATISQACREAGIAFSTPITVQTYHAALALVRHGLGAALVDSCTALSADLDDVEVVALEPKMPVAILAARPASAPTSVTVRKFTKAVQQVLAASI
jgi:DNA-binding transcriptional LysR family regulator